ncbi:MAG TPA: hypothetical protein VEU62_04155 [Bryobacterales bacterium]|nr:hypothetical protein [Bryobacterales bacterium]
MSCMLSSQNRFYAAVEAAYGQAPAVAAANRFSAIKVGIKQQLQLGDRKDKTGSRTFTGVAPGGRKKTQFDVQTYLMTGTTPGMAPATGPLFQAALGGAPLAFAGGTAAAGSTTTQIVFSAPHGLVVGQAFGFNNELRFANTINSPTSVTANAPFSTAPGAGASLTGAVTYTPATNLPSVSVFDYWDPAGAVSRILTGAACGVFKVKINSDFHEFEFTGEAQEVLDSVSFTVGQGGLSAFPAEPAVSPFIAMPVPGNLGEAWLGATASQFLTVTKAIISLDNGLDTRNRDFGSSVPLCIAPGVRRVLAEVHLFEAADAATQGLYQAARSQTPIGVMFQLGPSAGQLFGVYLKAVVPQVPEFDDSNRALEWSFTNCRAQGAGNDEIYVAFG